jgi:hypothetical protein
VIKEQSLRQASKGSEEKVATGFKGKDGVAAPLVAHPPAQLQLGPPVELALLLQLKQVLYALQEWGCT